MLGSPQLNQRRIIEEYYSDRCALQRLDDTRIPGCVDYWRVRHLDGRGTFFIILLSKSQLAEELGGASRNGDRLEPEFRGLARDLESQLQSQSHIEATHYWVTGWLYPTNRVDSKGRPYQALDTRRLNLLACDLQGASGPWMGNAYALRIIRKVALRLATSVDNRSYFSYKSPQDWEAVIQGIDWVKWLEGYTRSEKGGIYPDHVLQPLKPDRRKLGGKYRLDG
ncbi:hypothetical protein [Egbenema bharatensis]|uniref:hypothetical protein n=1 Tax=Egbenema bharatensis TaxID=3463334 RepID=UPI003A846069